MYALKSLTIVAVLCLVVSVAQATTIHVPSEQPTIQAGIDLAVEIPVADSNLIYSAWVASHEYLHSEMPDSGFICWSSFSPFCNYGGSYPPGRAGFGLSQLENGNYMAIGYALRDTTVDGYFAYWCEMTYDNDWHLVELTGTMAGSWFTGTRDVCDCNPDRGHVSDTSKTLLVPGWYASIQSAIDCAAAGDTVLVAPGTYEGAITYGGKNIHVISESGPDNTFLTASGTVTRMVLFSSDDSTATFQGFTIQDVDHTESVVRLGLSGAIRNCRFLNNTAAGTDGVVLAGSGSGTGYAIIEDCVFEGNEEGAIHSDRGHGRISGNRFVGNHRINGPYGGGVGWGNQGVSTVLIENNLFVGNSSSRGAAIFLSRNDSSIIRNNTIVGNTASGGGAIKMWTDCYDIVIENNIVAWNANYGVSGYGDQGTEHLNCNNFYGNLPEDYSEDIDPGPQHFSVDPLFCDTTAGDYSLQALSPCSPDNSSCGGMGALAVGCDQAVILAFSIEGESDLQHIIDCTPTFVWQLDQSFGFWRERFEIAIGTDDDWGYAEMWNPAPFETADTFVTYAGATLFDGETYYLRLRVSNGVDWSPWYQTSFRMNSVPSIPMPLHPTDDEIVDQQPTLWVQNSSDSEGDLLTHDFFVVVDTLYGEPDPQEGNGVVETADSTGWQVPSSLDENKRYFWRARASDGYEYSDWTDLFSSAFFVDGAPEPPTAPTPTWPPDTSGLPVFDLTPTFAWGASFDPDPFDTVMYTLDLAVDSGFTFVNTIDSIPVTEYTLGYSLSFSTQYWWRVSASDIAGQVTQSESDKQFWTRTLGDLDHNHDVDIADLIFLVTFMFQEGPEPHPLFIMDINGDCTGPDIADLIHLVSYMFQDGPPPASCD